jgi:HlyD family secretion protein
MIARLRTLWSQRPAMSAAVLLLVVIAGGLGAARLAGRPPAVATAEVMRGEYLDSLPVRGEVKALRSITMAAPGEIGGLQIVKIVSDGAQVKKGDSIVEFDKTRTEQELAQHKSALRSAQAEIEQARAQTRLVEEQDLTAVMKARFEVDTSKLEAGKQEILSTIDGAKARLKVADAEQKLREAEEKQKANETSAKATIEGKTQAREKALFDVKRAEHSLTLMTIRSPADGVITLVQLWRNEGQAAFKPGDQAWPGAPIAELPDMSTIRVSSRADETERGRLRDGQPVSVQLDAIPDRPFTGRITQISAIATTDFSSGWPFRRNFNIEIALDQSDPRLRPGMTAQITIIVDRLENAITIPVQASFQKSGHTLAYVLHGTKFEERTIEVGRRNGDRILVARGLNSGERVALQDPLEKP